MPTALIGRGMADWVEIGLAWFFLLSGAALCLQWQGRFIARRYFVGRVAATYPAFWLGFAALFLYGEVLHGNNADIPRWRVIFSLLGLDGYLTPVTVTFYKIGEWFLGVILILYLVFPLLLWCMETQLRRRALAACMAVNNETGAVQDIAALGKGIKARNSRTHFHVDAVQAWLRMPIDLQKWREVDSLSVSGHKVHAPKGVGLSLIHISEPTRRS